MKPTPVSSSTFDRAHRLLMGAETRLSRTMLTSALRRKGVHVGEGCTFHGTPIITFETRNVIAIGDRVVLTSRSRRTALGVNHAVVIRSMTRTGIVEIGSDTGISGGSICAARRVSIGSRCLLGANVTIVDTDFHPVDLRNRRYAPAPPSEQEDEVEIGDDVFIGTGAIILKGTRIGAHAVVGAGAVVRGSVPEGTIVAGNPARAIRMLSGASAGV